jgi:heat shock protein HtpX
MVVTFVATMALNGVLLWATRWIGTLLVEGLHALAAYQGTNDIPGMLKLWALAILFPFELLPQLPAAFAQPAVYFGVGIPVLLVAQLWFVKRQTMSVTGAQRVSRDEYPELFGTIDRLAKQFSVPVPTVAVADSPVPNSMTVGTGRSATIVVSEPLLATLSEPELQAVLAHEFAHVKNGDVKYQSIATFPVVFCAGLYGLTYNISKGFQYIYLIITIEGRGGRIYGRILQFGIVSGIVGFVVWNVEDVVNVPLLDLLGRVGFWLGVGLVLTYPFLLLVLLGTLFTWPPVRFVLRKAFISPARSVAESLSSSFSSYREFIADETAATVTGDPLALAQALQKLDDEIESTPTEDLRSSATVQHMSILPGGLPIPDDDGDEQDDDSLTVAGHPLTAERIDRLQQLASDLESQ